jgi:uncharacterized membrane protein
MSRFTTKKILYFFFKGILILVPLVFTVYLILVTLNWVDNLVPSSLPGLGLIIVLTVIVAVGYLASSFITQPIFDYIEEQVARAPVVGIIYSSIKDMLAAFVGDQKKFNQPIIVEMEPNSGLYKVGFMTQQDMQVMTLPGSVAVYLPHSYNFSGNLYLVPRERVTLLNLPSADVMKFAVSGGVSGFAELILADEQARRQAKSGQGSVPSGNPTSNPKPVDRDPERMTALQSEAIVASE